MLSGKDQKDFIVRTIKQFSFVLAAILKKKNAGQVVEAHHELEQIYSPFFGLDYKTVHALDAETLKVLVGDASHIKALGQLLHEHALFYKESGDLEAAEICTRKAELLKTCQSVS